MKRLLHVVSLLVLSLSVPVQAQEGRELYFPTVVSGEVADGLMFQDIFILINRGEEAIQTELQIHTNDGTEHSSYPFEVPPGELRSRSLAYWGLLPPRIPPEIQGWAKLRIPPGAAVRAHQHLFVTAFKPGTQPPIASATTEAVVPGRLFRILLPNASLGGRHAIAIVNPSTEEEARVQIDVEEVRVPGCPVQVTVGPLGRMSRMLQDDLCERPMFTIFPPEQAILTLSSDVPIAVSAMEFFPTTGGLCSSAHGDG